MIDWISSFDWIGLGALLIAIVVHEFGHLIGYRLAGYKAKIKLTWFGLSCGSNLDNSKIPPNKMFSIVTLGPWSGLIILQILDVIGNHYGWFNIIERVYWVYALCCSLDIAIITAILDNVFNNIRKKRNEKIQ